MQIRNRDVMKAKQIDGSVSALGPANYQAAGRPTLTFNNLKNIENIRDIVMDTDSALYTPQPFSVAGNVLTYIVGIGANGPRTECVNGTDLGAVTFRATAVGS